jgi:hypothetical protein
MLAERSVKGDLFFSIDTLCSDLGYFRIITRNKKWVNYEFSETFSDMYTLTSIFSQDTNRSDINRTKLRYIKTYD